MNGLPQTCETIASLIAVRPCYTQLKVNQRPFADRTAQLAGFFIFALVITHCHVKAKINISMVQRFQLKLVRMSDLISVANCFLQPIGSYFRDTPRI